MKLIQNLVNAEILQKDENEFNDMFNTNLEMYSDIYDEEDKNKRNRKLARFVVKSNIYAIEVACCHELINRLMKNPIIKCIILKTLNDMRLNDTIY